MNRIFLKEVSKKNWFIYTDNNYPGDENIKLGCLMRIADATELMSINHNNLINENKFYKNLSQNQSETIRSLKNTIRTLK